MESKTILLVVSAYEQSYLPMMKTLLQGHKTSATSHVPTTVQFMVDRARQQGCTAIITSQPEFITLLASRLGDPKPSPSNYEGSIFHVGDLEILCIPALKKTHTLNYGKFLLKRYLSKILQPEKWFKQTELRYKEVKSAADIQEMCDALALAEIIVTDTETRYNNHEVFEKLKKKCDKNGTPEVFKPFQDFLDCIGDKIRVPIIKEHGFTGIFWNEAEQCYETQTFVFALLANNGFDLLYEEKYEALRFIHEDLPQPKYAQNGKYDINVLMAHGIAVQNYAGDTINLFHCMFCELPKDLAAILAYSIRDMCYWKWMSSVNDDETAAYYNAIDTWGTANALLSLIGEMEDYAFVNYTECEWPDVHPAIFCELQGIPVDLNVLRAAKEEREIAAEKELEELRYMLNVPAFNPNSPPQVLKLVHAFGWTDEKSTNEKDLEAVAFKDNLLGFLIDKILTIRGIKKEISTYLVEEKVIFGRVYFGLHPHGTDTSRFSSSEHSFNIGLNIQNIPRGDEDEVLAFTHGVKDIFVLPDGYEFFEVDKEQAESRWTGYISGDEVLINAVDCGKDFHSQNASMFFGVPYEEIYDDAKHKAINKPLRTLSKPVNHGSNYNMGDKMLVRTMTPKKVAEAKTLLGLPTDWSLVKVGGYLLERFNVTYKTLKGPFYTSIINRVKLEGKLVNPFGWTRICFGKPWDNKLDKNALVAQLPQSSNARDLARGFRRVFWQYMLTPEWHKEFFLFAQVHDSILGGYKVTDKPQSYYPLKVAELMTEPYPVKDTFGKTRIITVPSDASYGKRSWGAIK